MYSSINNLYVNNLAPTSYSQKNYSKINLFFVDRLWFAEFNFKLITCT